MLSLKTVSRYEGSISKVYGIGLEMKVLVFNIRDSRAQGLDDTCEGASSEGSRGVSRPPPLSSSTRDPRRSPRRNSSAPGDVGFVFQGAGGGRGPDTLTPLGG